MKVLLMSDMLQLVVEIGDSHVLKRPFGKDNDKLKHIEHIYVAFENRRTISAIGNPMQTIRIDI